MEILSSRVLIRPKDKQRTVHFYSQVLGLPIYREFGDSASPGVVFFLGGGFLEVSGQSEESGTGATQLWLQVRDIRAAHQRLVDHGVVIEQPPAVKPWGLHEMRARDPDERQLVFVEVPPDHPLCRDPRGSNTGT